jgi:hypothetical protein
VLEELMLDAVEVDGALVAPASARSIAADVGLDAGTVASALSVLRRRGLVELARTHGPCGRFGLSSYRLRPMAGIEVVVACGDSPRAVEPDTVDAHAARGTVGATRARRRTAPLTEQAALDLGLDLR